MDFEVSFEIHRPLVLWSLEMSPSCLEVTWSCEWSPRPILPGLWGVPHLSSIPGPLDPSECPKWSADPEWTSLLYQTAGNVTLRIHLPEQRSICKLNRILFLSEKQWWTQGWPRYILEAAGWGQSRAWPSGGTLSMLLSRDATHSVPGMEEIPSIQEYDINFMSCD